MNFEALADQFQQYFQIGAVSRCDVLELDEDETRLIEQTNYALNKKKLA